jgi:hypothetical protein
MIKVMKSSQKSELKKILTEVIINHWDKYLKGALKKDLLLPLYTNFTMRGYSVDDYLMSRLGRSLDSSRGNLWEKIMVTLSEFFNEKTYGKIAGLNIKSTGKQWIIDLAFERNGTTYLIEIKLACNLDNKKAKSEATALKDRKECLLENNLASDVKPYLGVVCLGNGESSPQDWVMGRVSEGFKRNEVLVEKELFDFVTNDSDVFNFIVDIIQPIAMKYEKSVMKSIKNKYL